jgi:hypothetical protein
MRKLISGEANVFNSQKELLFHCKREALLMQSQPVRRNAFGRIQHLGGSVATANLAFLTTQTTYA